MHVTCKYMHLGESYKTMQDLVTVKILTMLSDYIIMKKEGKANGRKEGH